MIKEKVIIIGAGPCGLSAALQLKRYGVNPLIIEKGNVVNSIYHYPTHQTFFSSSEKLEIGDVPFISERQKPVRNEALTYYRTVAERNQLRINSYEKVVDGHKNSNKFILTTEKQDGTITNYEAKYVIIATGYYDQPNMLHIEGEELPKVFHYFKEAHPFYQKKIVVIGGKNSAVDATLELVKAGAEVTVIYRGDSYSKSIKPWILPLFDSLIQKGIVKMIFNGNVTKITNEHVFYEVNQKEYKLENDFVFAMTGYHPDYTFLQKFHIERDDETGRPHFHPETMETNVENVYIAGVIAAGYNNNEIFIENGRFHGELIAASISKKEKLGDK